MQLYADLDIGYLGILDGNSCKLYADLDIGYLVILDGTSYMCI